MSPDYLKQIQEIRAVTNWSQQQFAQEVGVTFAAFNRWLNQGVAPREIYLQKIRVLHKHWVAAKPLDLAGFKKELLNTQKYKIKNVAKLLQQNQALREEMLLQHTYNSNAIEGSTFTLKETEGVLFSKAHIQDKSLVEHLEVVNHGKVLQDILVGKYALPVTESLIKAMHRDLMHGIRDDAGEYSKHLRRIRGVDLALPHPEDVPEEMRRLIRGQRGAGRLHPLEQVAQFHADFEAIHPFGDGNGRVGRLIMVLQLMHENYPPIFIPTNRKAEYYDALEKSQRHSHVHLTKFLLSELPRIHNLISKITKT